MHEYEHTIEGRRYTIAVNQENAKNPSFTTPRNSTEDFTCTYKIEVTNKEDPSDSDYVILKNIRMDSDEFFQVV